MRIVGADGGGGCDEMRAHGRHGMCCERLAEQIQAGWLCCRGAPPLPQPPQAHLPVCEGLFASGYHSASACPAAPQVHLLSISQAVTVCPAAG